MVFVDSCVGCGKEWSFHDDEKGKSMLLCSSCHDEWVKIRLVHDIVTGEFAPGKEADAEDE